MAVNEPIEVKVRPMQKPTPAYRRIYNRVRTYIPNTSEKGKGALYAGVGLGVAGAIFLVGYGAEQLLSSASPTNVCGSGTQCSSQMNACTSQLNQLITEYNQYSSAFLAEDAAKNISLTTQQQSFLNNIIGQENQVMQNCVGGVVNTYKLDFVQSSIQEIATAIAIAITVIAGAKALSYIKSKGYFKKPPQTPGGGMQVMVEGMLDYMKATGQLPATWNYGKGTVQSGTQAAVNQVSNYTAELVSLNIIDATIAASIIAAETAMLAETEVIAIAALA